MYDKDDNEKPIFQLKHVAKYFGSKKVLSDVNLEIFPGEILGIIGASGAGKTTLLNVLIGFLRPEIGEVLFRFEHLLSFKNTEVYRNVFKKQLEIKKMIGFAAQKPSFYPNLTVQENLEYFGALFNLSNDALGSNIDALLNLMELKSSRYVLSKNLSGGMQRRLDIACSLIHDPKILILDEPTADLDPILRNHIRELIKIIQSRGTTILLSSHHLAEIEDLCNRIAILKDGTFVEVDTMEKIRKKYIRHKKIHIQTKSKDYEKLMKKMPQELVNQYQVVNRELVISSNQPEEILKKILDKCEKENDKLISLEIRNPSLDEIFISLSRNITKRQKEQDKEENQEQLVKKEAKNKKNKNDKEDNDTLHHNIYQSKNKKDDSEKNSTISQNAFIYE